MGRKRRIVILGGGAGALSAAFGLTNYPGWREQYEVAVYQLGWRLGGKGASGRNRDVAQRIEEHGLHVWMGHYENAFRMIRAVYGELGRPRGTPLATWDEAFQKHSFITLAERTATGWEPWQLDFPTNSDEPGDGRELPSVAAYLEMGLRGVLSLLVREAPRVTRLVAGVPDPVALPGPVEGTLQALGIMYQQVMAPAGVRSLRLAQQVAARLSRPTGIENCSDFIASRGLDR